MGSGPGSLGSRSSLESVSMSAVSYRPATLADAELAADVMTAAYPAMPQDPVIMRLRWESPRKGFAHGRFIAERDGAPIGYLGWVHGPWDKLPDRHCEVEVCPSRGIPTVACWSRCSRGLANRGSRTVRACS